jgi:hypothetical protein
MSLRFRPNVSPVASEISLLIRCVDLADRDAAQDEVAGIPHGHVKNVAC